MGQKRRHGSTGGRGKHKRRKLNLLTIRQKNDYRQLGEPHPIEDSTKVKSYSKVTQAENQSKNDSSSDESEQEMPAIKQLMEEIGVKEDESEEEETGEESEEEETDDGSDQEDPGAETNKNEKHARAEPDASRDSESSADEDGDEEEDVGDFDDDEDKLKTSDSEEESTKSKTAVLKNEKQLLESENVIIETLAEEEEDEETEDEDNNELCLKESDPFTKHFEVDNDFSAIAESGGTKWQKKQIKVPGLGKSLLLFKDPSYLPHPETDTDLNKLHVKQKLCQQVLSTNTQQANIIPTPGASLSALQHRLFCGINSYQDLMYPKQTVHNLEEIRLVYTLHALNHVLKARSRVIAHNTKLKNKTIDADDDVEYRDQGLTRPKVLIILPYRDKALKVVNMIISLLSSTQQANVSNRKRFESEYSELGNSDLAEKGFKPEDFRITFQGNTDDNFRVGMSVSKKSLRLYSPFYESDIILASPLGLRTIIGLEGDRERDFDFLSSIEVLIVDQTDIYLMQNWDHFTHVFKHLHLQPREYHNCDFSRVRMWSINGWSKHYRQTVILSRVILPEIVTIFNKHCHNYTGKLFVQREEKLGSIKSSASDSPQIFHRVNCDAPNGLSQMHAKFEYLKKKIIPYYTSSGMKQTLIYCNYYSFVHLRNYFRESEIDFLFINEYDSEKHVRNARIHFRKRHPHFMLYTERLHFHYRFRLRGIHHVLWFDLPQYPQFYPEFVNLMETSHHTCTCTALYTRYDAQKLMEIVGSKRAAHMIGAEKSVNMITVS